ncbi:MAG: BlaI/MecI/CopY family transcriptional regulator [Chloroflexi bacterium]|nr:BlaI/MecI/CopY family transcriptional regulator [Chloroflexota bacterium]
MTKRGKRENAISGLTALEAEILGVVWEQGRASVRDVHEKVLKLKYVPYTTVAAVMKNLGAKEILTVSHVGKTFYFEAKVDRLGLAKKIVDSVIDKVLGGSTVSLVSYLLSNKVSEEERKKVMEKLICA